MNCAVCFRRELLGPASLVPDAWMQESCALGSVDACAKALTRFADAGVDEIVTYGSTPNQNAALAAAWWAEQESPVQVSNTRP